MDRRGKEARQECALGKELWPLAQWELLLAEHATRRGEDRSFGQAK